VAGRGRPGAHAHGFIRHRRTFYRALSTGPTYLPFSWFRRRCAVLNNDRKIGLIAGNAHKSCCAPRSARKPAAAARPVTVLVVLGRDPYGARWTVERLTMATGTVKWFNPTKGYGFIQPSGGGGKDVFVHISAVERAGLSSLNEGQTVEYEIESNRGKESAVNLKVR